MKPALPASAFSFTGGKVVWANTTSIGAGRAHFLPPAGTTFEHRSSGSGFWVDSSGTYSFDGTYVATNRNSGHPNVYNYKTTLGFAGNGTFIVDAFRIRNGYTTTIRSKAVKLGRNNVDIVISNADAARVRSSSYNFRRECKVIVVSK